MTVQWPIVRADTNHKCSWTRGHTWVASTRLASMAIIGKVDSWTLHQSSARHVCSSKVSGTNVYSNQAVTASSIVGGSLLTLCFFLAFLFGRLSSLGGGLVRSSQLDGTGGSSMAASPAESLPSLPSPAAVGPCTTLCNCRGNKPRHYSHP